MPIESTGLLRPGVSLTLENSSDGWRFSSWGKTVLLRRHPLTIEPTEAHRQLRFRTTEAAFAFFRAEYGMKIERELGGTASG